MERQAQGCPQTPRVQGSGSGGLALALTVAVTIPAHQLVEFSTSDPGLGSVLKGAALGLGGGGPTSLCPRLNLGDPSVSP